MAEITLDGVRKVFADGTEAVQSFDLEIPDGSFMVLVGPSGCGKTTVLRMVAGLEDLTDGHDPDRRPDRERRPARRAGHRDGVPELRPVSAHDRVPEHGAQPEDPQGQEATR